MMVRSEFQQEMCMFSEDAPPCGQKAILRGMLTCSVKSQSYSFISGFIFMTAVSFRDVVVVVI